MRLSHTAIKICESQDRAINGHKELTFRALCILFPAMRHPLM